jgi:hypothetical protein
LPDGEIAVEFDVCVVAAKDSGLAVASTIRLSIT